MKKITFKGLLIFVMALTSGLLQAAAPPPPVPPPPPGLSIDANILVLIGASLIFGIYKLQSYNLKNISN